ncbi:MAG: hypothetical protein VKN72_03980 [Nostocales cyanobacterium 94392]|nr:hypothetical protein [Nostocales cyanobacterium 94392]
MVCRLIFILVEWASHFSTKLYSTSDRTSNLTRTAKAIALLNQALLYKHRTLNLTLTVQANDLLSASH